MEPCCHLGLGATAGLALGAPGEPRQHPQASGSSLLVTGDEVGRGSSRPHTPAARVLPPARKPRPLRSPTAFSIHGKQTWVARGGVPQGLGQQRPPKSRRPRASGRALIWDRATEQPRGETMLDAGWAGNPSNGHLVRGRGTWTAGRGHGGRRLRTRAAEQGPRGRRAGGGGRGRAVPGAFGRRCPRQHLDFCCFKPRGPRCLSQQPQDTGTRPGPRPRAHRTTLPAETSAHWGPLGRPTSWTGPRTPTPTPCAQ